MKLVVGLGNPGSRYAASRHNVGWRIVEGLADSLGVALARERFLGRYGEGTLDCAASDPGSDAGERIPVGLLEPTTFMNESGRAIRAALAGLPLLEPERDLLVVHDDLDLAPGRIRLRPEGGAGGHRGMESVIDALESQRFARLRFGIGRPPQGQEVLDFVLEPFSSVEEAQLTARIETAAEAIRVALCRGVRAAMEQFNRAPAAEGDSG